MHICVCIMSQQNLKTCFSRLYNADFTHCFDAEASEMHGELPFSSYCAVFALNRAFSLLNIKLNDKVWLHQYGCLHRWAGDAFDFKRYDLQTIYSLIRYKNITQYILFITRTFLLAFSAIWLMFNFHFLLPTHKPKQTLLHILNSIFCILASDHRFIV